MIWNGEFTAFGRLVRGARLVIAAGEGGTDTCAMGETPKAKSGAHEKVVWGGESRHSLCLFVFFLSFLVSGSREWVNEEEKQRKTHDALYTTSITRSGAVYA